MDRVLLIGGNFDINGGRPSKIIDTIYRELSNIQDIDLLPLVNGGYYSSIPGIINSLVNVDIVLWFPNVANDYEKMRNIKERYPNIILISSKRNADNEYDFQYLINHALSLKSNLLLEFNKKGKDVTMRVLDPLGVVWCDYTRDSAEVAQKLMERAKRLRTFTRVPSKQIGEAQEIPDKPEFFELIKRFAAVFHKLINPTEGVTRFLGNASFRCERGFPSFREGEMIYMSRRNVDKRYIERESFVAMPLEAQEVSYYGDVKPSVDSPIQLALYKYYKDVNYIVHSHVYIKDAPFTTQAIPCGAFEEFTEITKLVPDPESTDFCVNLLGHGSLILCSDVDYMKKVKYYARPQGEIIKEDL